MYPYEFDYLSDDTLRSLVSLVRPVARVNPYDRHPHYIDMKDVDPKKHSFLWSPKFKGLARGLECIGTSTTYHPFAYKGFFKPTYCEVIVQIPVDLINHVDAFEIVSWPQTADDLNHEHEATRAGYHVARVNFYRKRGLRRWLLDHVFVTETGV